MMYVNNFTACFLYFTGRTKLFSSVSYNTMYIFFRTDAGVHALGNTAHVELENKYNTIYNSSDIKKFVNRYLSKCSHTIR